MKKEDKSEPLVYLIENDVVRHKSNPYLIGNVSTALKTGIHDLPADIEDDVVWILIVYLFINFILIVFGKVTRRSCWS